MTQHTRIVDALSALVLQILDADQSSEFAVPVAPLSAGKIQLGRQYVNDRTSPSQIIFVPVSFSFEPVHGVSNAVKAQDGSQPGRVARILRRPLASKPTTYEVHVWGQANPADPAKDFDATDYLCDVVVQAAQILAMGSAGLGGSRGVWTDQQDGAPQLVKAGHRAQFLLSIAAPVLDSSVQPAPPLHAVPTVAVS